MTRAGMWFTSWSVLTVDLVKKSPEDFILNGQCFRPIACFNLELLVHLYQATRLHILISYRAR